MSSRIRTLIAAAAGQLPTLLVLAALVGIAVWGANNDWKGLPFAQAETKKEEEKESAVKIAPSALLSLSGWARPELEFPSADVVRRAGIKVAKAESRDLKQYVTATGMVDYDPSHYTRLTARASGTVWRVRKDIGEAVSKDEVLALIEAAEVGKYKADFLQSLTQVKLRGITLEQMEEGRLKGSVPLRTLLDARAALREAQIRLDNAEQALLNLGLPLRRREVESLPDDRQTKHLRLLGLPPYLLKDLDVETLTANLLPLIAPFNGVVVQRNVAPGESVLANQGRSLFVIADIHRLHVDMDVNPGDAIDVRLKQTIEFAPAGKGPGAVGKVSHISPEVDEKTRRVRIHAKVDNRDGKLRPNTFGTGRILIREQPEAVVIPADALQSDGQRHFVFVKRNETTFECRLVEPGLREGNWVQVLSQEERLAQARRASAGIPWLTRRAYVTILLAKVTFDVRPGEEVVTAGSFALKSELLKDRIGGGD